MMATMKSSAIKPTQLKSWLRLTIYLLMVVLLITGVLWMSIHFFQWPDAAAPLMEGLPSPWEAPLMKIHGAAMLLMIFILGRLSGTHVLLFWRMRRRRKEGAILLAAFGILALSAYLFYYWIPEDWRDYLGWAHGAMGALTALLLAWHRRAVAQ